MAVKFGNEAFEEEKMSLPIFQVDAFTDRLFTGNPAAVVLLEGQRESAWMQTVAAEMNLSETAFVHPLQGGFHLQWFTPATEVELCGHATLSAAHILWQTGLVKESDRIRFSTLSGWLGAEKKGPIIELDFPFAPVTEADASEEIIRAVGAVPDRVSLSRENWIFEYSDESIVKGIKPDFAALKERKGSGLAVTAISDRPGIDFVSRYFTPWHGINEDPVTGSAHCYLGTYWGKKLGKSQLTGYQASARGGIVSVRLSAERVYIGGKALTVFSGKLLD
jgi:PhzF family phenazine biosynthesis protein